MKWEELNSKQKVKRSGQFALIAAVLNSPVTLIAFNAYASIKNEIKENRENLIKTKELERSHAKDLERIDSNIQIIRSDIKLLLRIRKG